MRNCIIVLLLLTPLTAFWNQDTSVSSLDAYDKRISELRLQKNSLDTSWENFRNTYWGITDFIDTDLSSAQRERLAIIVENYLANLRENREDTNLRKDFFISIEEFIDSEKAELFERYRKKSMSIENERIELATLIRNTENQRQARTDILRSHIADNALERRQNIKQRIEPILRERLNAYVENESFKKLPDNRKALVFWRILWRIQMKQSELESSWVKTTVVLDRIETYKVIETIMIEYINSWG